MLYFSRTINQSIIVDNRVKKFLLGLIFVGGINAANGQGFYYTNKACYFKYLQDSIKLLNKYHKVSDLESEHFDLIYGHQAFLEKMNAEAYFDSIDAQNKVGGLTLPQIKKLKDHFDKFQSTEEYFYTGMLANMEKTFQLQQSSKGKRDKKSGAKK